MMSIRKLADAALDRLAGQGGTQVGTTLEQVERSSARPQNEAVPRSSAPIRVEHDNRRITAGFGHCSTVPRLGDGTVEHASPRRSRGASAWAASIRLIDPYRPPEGWLACRWFQLCEDAEWLVEAFGEHAARDGWSTADLFGLWPDKPHWGGIADRLRGSRSLVMTADMASWRHMGEVERFHRGSYPSLIPFWSALSIGTSSVCGTAKRKDGIDE